MRGAIVVWIEPGRDPGFLATVRLPADIGRAPSCDLILTEPQASGRHAHVDARQGAIQLTDLQSRNGTLIDERWTRDGPWGVGQTVQIGDTAITLLCTSVTATHILTAHLATGESRRFVARLPLAIDPDTGSPSTPISGSSHRRYVLVDRTDAGVRAAHVQGPAVPLRWHASGEFGQIRLLDLRLETRVSSRSAMAPTDLVFDSDGHSRPAKHASEPDTRFPPESFALRNVASMSEIEALEVPIIQTEFLALGGGMGSFVWVDALRVRGVPTERIRVIGHESVPYDRYKRLCENSQIPGHERLRSNSESCPDNLWGFPGYGLRESWKRLWQGRLFASASIAWMLAAEPDASATYTPQADHVFASIDREARRIGWDEMLSRGRIRMLRKTDREEFAVAVSSRPDVREPDAIYVAKQVHIALGYPGLQFLPDLQRYREQTVDFRHVVNAYEDHDHIYQDLRAAGGTVVLRGRGIVASRILQRLWETRRFGADIEVVHLMRSEKTEGNRAGKASRQVENHWEFQPFNWPEACWGGDLERALAQSGERERTRLLSAWGGTTTADRTDWRRIVRAGLRQGWYSIRFGEVQTIRQSTTGLWVTMLRSDEPIAADYIIDATGLVASPQVNPFWADLIETYGLPLNPAGRLEVTPSFELAGLRQGSNRAWAAGVATLGGPYAPVDSFLGLQYAAQASLRTTTGVPRFGPGRSMRGWSRWMLGASP